MLEKSMKVLHCPRGALKDHWGLTERCPEEPGAYWAIRKVPVRSQGHKAPGARDCCFPQEQTPLSGAQQAVAPEPGGYRMDPGPTPSLLLPRRRHGSWCGESTGQAREPRTRWQEVMSGSWCFPGYFNTKVTACSRTSRSGAIIHRQLVTPQHEQPCTSQSPQPLPSLKSSSISPRNVPRSPGRSPCVALSSPEGVPGMPAEGRQPPGEPGQPPVPPPRLMLAASPRSCCFSQTLHQAPPLQQSNPKQLKKKEAQLGS